MGAGYLTMNRNKRSICVDLGRPAGLAVLHRLVGDADVLISNMRRAAADRLGIDPESLRSHNPDLVYCLANGYGRGGPYADEPAYDDVMQARIGLASLLTDTEGRPALAPTVLADKITGLYLVQAVLAALVARERTGVAHVVEVPMFETMTSFLFAEHMGGAGFDPPLGPPGYNRLTTPNR
jgi:crotonobetainyl-CoA:carnitine CoA-transferase CaiB-like acyl-CoA transferase